jgi:hypothetical protein
LFTLTTRAARTGLTAIVLLGCSEGAPPTQPADRAPATPAVRVPAMTSSADIGTSALATTTLYACYIPGKGLVYRIKTDGTPTECAKSDVQFSWTDPGANAGLITGLTFHSANLAVPEIGRLNFGCSDGQSLINFGYEAAPGNNTQPRGSRPTFTTLGIRWQFTATVGTEWNFYWTCANAAPAVVFQ